MAKSNKKSRRLFDHGRKLHNQILEPGPQVVPERKTITIEIPIEQAEQWRFRLADLTCWWQGFKTGIRTVEEFQNVTTIPDSGIRVIRDINDILDRKLHK